MRKTSLRKKASLIWFINWFSLTVKFRWKMLFLLVLGFFLSKSNYILIELVPFLRLPSKTLLDWFISNYIDLCKYASERQNLYLKNRSQWPCLLNLGIFIIIELCSMFYIDLQNYWFVLRQENSKSSQRCIQ